MAEGLTSYKYRSGAAALRALSDGTAYFASPKELNDSLEAKFDVADSEQHLKVAQETISKLSVNRGGPAYQRGGQTTDEFRVANERETGLFVAACEQVGIFSCAPRPDNQPMWAYYCGSGQGVCFHFEWSKQVIERYHLYPVEVTYSDHARVVNRAEYERQALTELAAQNPRWSIEQLKAFSLTEPFRRKVGMRAVAGAVSTKHMDWRHEQEIRMLAPHTGPLPIIRDILRSVIFTRTDFAEWGPILMLLRQLYPDVQVAMMTFSHREPFVTSKLMTMKMIPIETDENPWTDCALAAESR